MTSQLTIDHDQAHAHVAALGGGSRIFFVAPEAPGIDGEPCHLFGTLDDVLPDLDAAQRAGCGVFVAVNTFTGRRRLKAELLRTFVLYGPIAMRQAAGCRSRPHCAFARRPARGTTIWSATPPTRYCRPRPSASSGPSSPTTAPIRHARDLARVLRLAGSMHLKGEPQRVEIIGGTGETYSRAQLLAAFPEPEPLPRPVRMSMPAAAVPGDRYLAATVDGVIRDLAAAVPGSRNASLNAAAFRLGQLGLGLARIAALLTPTALEIGLKPHEITATISSGVRAGAAQPRGRAA